MDPLKNMYVCQELQKYYIITCIKVFIHRLGVIGDKPQFNPFNTTSSIWTISSSEHAPSVTNANSCSLGGYISSILAAMKRHDTPGIK